MESCQVMISNITQETCLNCSKTQKTCCYGYPSIPFTLSEIEKIEQKGFKKKDFIIAGDYTDENLEPHEKWWKESMVKSGKRLLKTNVHVDAVGKCFFLEEGKGCVLGNDRPAVCKIFPFWIKDDQIYYEPNEGLCPKEKNLSFIKEALSSLNETEESIKGYYEEIKEDCINNKKEHEKILRELYPYEF